MTPNLGLSSSTLRADAIAGLTAAAVVLPKAMAYATVAGLSVSVGLYTAFVPLIVYALIGTSRVLSVSSTTTLAILTGAQLGLAVPDGDPVKLTVAAATLTALTGVLLIGASVLRLGFLANFISTPVLTGFKAGIGLVIVLDQVPKLVGIHITKQGFFHDIASLAQHVPEASLITVAVAAAALVALLVAERLKPHSSAPLFVVAAGIAASWFQPAGVGRRNRRHHSAIAARIDAAELRPGGAAAARGAGHRPDELYRNNRRRAGVCGAGRPPDHRQPGTGSDRRREPGWRLVRRDAGRRRDLADRRGPRSRRADADRLAGHRRSGSGDHAGVCAVSRAAAAGGAAAVVIVYSVGLISPAEFIAIRKIRTLEFTWAIAALVGVLIFGTLQGILVAIVLSLIGLSSQVVNSKVYVIGRKRGADVLRPLSPENPDDETFEGLLILRPEGRLFFANAQQVGDQIRALVAEHRPSVVALDLSRVPDIEYSALQMLLDGERRFTADGVTVWLAAANPNVLACIRASPLAELGRGGAVQRPRGHHEVSGPGCD